MAVFGLLYTVRDGSFSNGGIGLLGFLSLSTQGTSVAYLCCLSSWDAGWPKCTTDTINKNYSSVTSHSSVCLINNYVYLNESINQLIKNLKSVMPRSWTVSEWDVPTHRYLLFPLINYVCHYIKLYPVTSEDLQIVQ